MRYYFEYVKAGFMMVTGGFLFSENSRIIEPSGNQKEVFL
jgi:hypothetical protein